MSKSASQLPASSSSALAFIHEGWEHLRLQRPLAAWASWQKALRVEPENRAASEALAVLEQAEELPVSARLVYRFRPAETAEARERWTAAFANRDLQELSIAASVFAELLEDDPDDAATAFNLGLCWAWDGQNDLAIAALDKAVQIDASSLPEQAIASWVIAEILRQGAGAEDEADDWTHTLTLDWPSEFGDLFERLGGFATIRRLPQIASVPGQLPLAEVALAEWLDPPSSESGRLWSEVVATVSARNHLLQLTSPDALSLSRAEAILEENLADQFRPTDRRSTPLPLRFMDAAAWTFRIAAPDDASATSSIRRSAIEHYYEEVWIHRPRKGLAASLGDSAATPAEASRGNAISKAKLAAIINIREQLAARPRMAAMVDGYPFDRLRRRLGLAMIDESTVETADVSCMSCSEFAELELSKLSEEVLKEAVTASQTLCDESTTERIRAELATRVLSRTGERQ